MARSQPQALLLVDGYNVVGAWPELARIRDRHGLEASRYRLAETLTGYSAYQDFDTRLVFDAQYRDSGSSQEVITPNLTIHFTEFGQTADTHIERVCADFRYDLRKFYQRLIVVTSDRAQQQTVIGYGAEWMSSDRLAAEVEMIARRIQRKQATPKKSSGRFLANCLDPAAQKRLSELRFGKSD